MPRENLEHDLYKIFKDFVKDAGKIQFSLDTKIDDLQLDSLDFLDLHLQLERNLEINIPVEKFILCNTIMDIEQLIQFVENTKKTAV